MAANNKERLLALARLIACASTNDKVDYSTMLHLIKKIKVHDIQILTSTRVSTWAEHWHWQLGKH